jgi:hypothetical protein
MGIFLSGFMASIEETVLGRRSEGEGWQPSSLFPSRFSSKVAATLLNGASEHGESESATWPFKSLARKLLTSSPGDRLTRNVASKPSS